MAPIDHPAESTDRRTRALSLADAQPVDERDTASDLRFPIVVVGASAGGVEVLRRLFALIPSDTGCAFVIVTHLAPERESLLATLIAHVAHMPAEQVDGEATLAPNRIFVAPPGHYLESRDGVLRTRPMHGRTPKPVTIDQCMISLAETERERMIGIVLTGADGDGALGIKAIKSEGGFTIAQTPESSAYPDMPRHAIATGLVDVQSTVEGIPNVIKEYLKGLNGVMDEVSDHALMHQLLPDVLQRLQQEFGLDFHGYKTPMLFRRIRRRMVLAQTNDPAAYARRLAEDEGEARALANDFLINVTEFFREPRAWETMASEIIPEILAAKQLGSSLRVWVPACSTGEEAYGLAMLLLEHPLTAERRLRVQIFATDVDRQALDRARRGRYGSTIEASMTPERLRRFFHQVPGGYEVRKELRELVMFAPHDVINDPPFSRMCLVSCRNLLIYLKSDVQKRVLLAFHFALDADGYLALGKSETVSAAPSLFASVADGARIFRRAGPARIPLAPPSAPHLWRAGAGAHNELPAARLADHAQLAREALKQPGVTATILTDTDGQVSYIAGSVRSFFEAPEGRPTTDLFALLVLTLRSPARVAMHNALTENTPSSTDVRVRSNHGGVSTVRVGASVVTTAVGSRMLLLSLSDLGRDEHGGSGTFAADDATRLVEEELLNTKQELRGVIEELELANEELKVANEEAMSMNEELQSSNEELETSKEELQSINEELTSVNDQLHEKVQELESVNDDIGNLLTSTHIPTLFLDPALNIKRFTPAATRLFRLISSDVDRPITDLATHSDLLSLVDDAREVLKTLAPIQNETRTAQGECFLRRTLPYRTRDGQVEGIVVTFTDISDVKKSAEELRRFAAVLHGSEDAIVVLDKAGGVKSWNTGATNLYGISESDILEKEFIALIPESQRASHADAIAKVLGGGSIRSVETQRLHANGSVIHVSTTFSFVPDETGAFDGVAMVERDITPFKRANEALSESERRFRLMADHAPVMIFLCDEAAALHFANTELSAFTGAAPEQLIGHRWTELVHGEDRNAIDLALRSDAERIDLSCRLLHQSGQYRWTKIIATKKNDAEHEGIGWLGTIVDIDAQVLSETSLRDADRRKDEFLAMLGHELRNPLAPIRNAAAVLASVEDSDPRIRWVRDLLERQVDHVTQLVDDLLDISRVSRGTLRLHLAPVDIRGSIQRAIDAVRPMVTRKKHTLEQSLPAEPVWVHGDAIRLTQLFENLLTNAAKYTDAGGHISIDVSVTGTHTVIRVRDNGLGIEEHMLPRIFDLFVQDERSVNRSQGGLGIGLALVRHLVELHAGTIEVRSDGPGHGSEFMVRLPTLKGGERRRSPRTNDLGEPLGARVLIVDDDRDAGESLCVVLELYGYEVKFASDVDAALSAARHLHPEIVLLDIAMPHVDGYEVARRLRLLPEIDENTHFLAISGFAQASDVARTVEAGFERHLAKPVNPRQLDVILREMLKARP